jgi:hypothetical protein
LVTTGRKIGVKIKTAGVMSIKIPTTRRMILIRISITHLLSLTVSINSLIICGISSADMTHDILMDVPISKSTTAVVSEDLTKIPGNSVHFNSL